MEDRLINLIKAAPKKPGIYQYYDKEKRILYVGKAKNLRNRVSSYFNNDKQQSGKTKVMVSKIADIKYILVDTEIDALLLENSLIKEHQPKYNVMLKDDKTYPWICIKNERFPRIFSTRNIVRDGSEYYGPYASVGMMYTILDLIKQNYPIRTCSFNLSEENIKQGKFKSCLEYHLGNCKAICEGKQTEEDYNKMIDEIRNILKGNINVVKQGLKKNMLEASSDLNFELAEELKGKLAQLERYQSKSTVVSPKIHDVDVFSLVEDNDLVYVNYFKVNNGAIIQGHTIEMKKKLEENKNDLLEIAIAELRQRFKSTSKEIIVPFVPQFKMPNVKFHAPVRGDKLKLLELSERNAKFFMLERRKQQAIKDPERHTNRILETMQKDLRLNELPRHIECFDNSNIQGTNPVAACVVFKDAKPSKKDYRHFNIKTVEGPDDFASMEEVVYRRCKRLQDEGSSLPQLIVIDGGKGQLSAALKSLDVLGLRGKIAIIGIAKRLEEIFYPGDKYPLYLNKSSETLKVIQQLRNEAHRFGITHHRNRRSKAGINTELSNIKGVGTTSAELLLKKFKSVKRIKEASLIELQEIVPLNRAQAVYQYFQGR